MIWLWELFVDPMLSLIQSGDVSAPVLLWLQGGPGGSSLFSLFIETGPLVVDSMGKGVSVREI